MLTGIGGQCVQAERGRYHVRCLCGAAEVVVVVVHAVTAASWMSERMMD